MAGVNKRRCSSGESAGRNRVITTAMAMRCPTRCITGYENKQVGRIAEAVIPGRDRAHHLMRNVIEKDRPIRQTAKQVQSEVSPWERKGCANPHGARLTAATFSKAMQARRPAALLQPGEPCRPLPRFPEGY